MRASAPSLWRQSPACPAPSWRPISSKARSIAIPAGHCAIDPVTSARRCCEFAASGSPLAGRHWPQRYAVRRIAWHALDHTWEIEDRIEP